MKKSGTAHRHCFLVLSFFFILALIACDFTPPSLPTFVPAVRETEPVFHPEKIQIYFTDPFALVSRNYEGGPDKILADAIDHARLSVDAAAYSLNLWSIRDALIHAHQRGVVVRMVMESDNMDNREVGQIKDAGIPVIGDQHESLMHDKFIIIDHSEVWTGSMNFTTNGAYKDNNNLVSIRSAQVAEDYTTEFEEMFIHHLFSSDTFADTPFPKLTIEGTPVEIYFSPEDKIAGHIVKLIQDAQENINFMVYTFTSKDIGNAIVEQANAGVSVAGVVDDSQNASIAGTVYDTMKQAGLDVHLSGNPRGLMHHKVIIIDQKVVITGSYNLTASAETANDENVVIMDSTEIAAKYMEEFQRVYSMAQTP